MKKSIALTIAILVLGVVPGLFLHARLTHLREEHRKLVVEAGKFGLSDHDSVETHLTKRHHVGIGKQAGAIADEIVSFSSEIEQLKKSGGKQDQALQDRALDVMSRLASLDPATLKQVIAALEENSSISEDTKRNIIGFAILNLSDDHPEAAVALFTEAAGILEKSTIGDQVISSALTRWAEVSPDAALSWIRANTAKYPEIAGDEAKRAIIAGSAANDPKLAFKLLGELNLDEKSGAIQAILASGQDAPEKRDAVLAALREHLAGISSDQERDELRGEAFESFARNLNSEDFEASTAWVVKAGFTAEEKEKFAAGLSYFNTKENTGKWIDWLSKNLSSESVTSPVSELVGEWTQQDYQSAGKWLVAAPDGPAKAAAVQAYATAVAEYEPKVAAQWAMTLPAGPARDSTLQSIYQNWPASDPDGAAAFAREHGLE